jgi:3-methyladenine DNA glycosylase/8-oxoguanine DNA glycosylase
MRFMLGIDDDHSEFLRRFRSDPMLGRAIGELAGLRPVRTDTVCHALLRALAGQLIEARRARAIERRVVRAVSPVDGPFAAAPTAAAFAGMAPVRLCRDGLSARKASTLVRLCRSVNLERLRTVAPDAVAARLARERGLGPWSVGVIFLEGLGRFDRGIVGDLGLVKLLSALRGRWVEGWETAELLEPYGEWAGLASVYLLAGWGAGLLPVPRDNWRRLGDVEAGLAAA